MSRLPRIVIPGYPHHVTQRGNRRAQTFFNKEDYLLYKDLLSEAAEKSNTEIWAYCFMPNHVHLIATPQDPERLRRTFADAHRRYTGYINARLRVTGHLWQGRFGAVIMDEDHLMHAARYVSLNPVRAGLVKSAEGWPWSSLHAHFTAQDDGLVKVSPLLERYGDFFTFLSHEIDEESIRRIRMSETTGRPAGSESWLETIESLTGRVLRPQKRGPKARQ